MTSPSKPMGERLDDWAAHDKPPIEITVDDEAVTLQESLRHLPKKRLTCRAKWQGQDVIAKIFYGKKFSTYAKNEKEMLRALMHANINMPSMLSVSEYDDCTVLIIDYIEGGQSLLSWLKGRPDEGEFKETFAKATALMLACHQRGFELKDPHLDNFLERKGQVFLIDAGDIKRIKKPLNKQQSIENLALLYAQLHVTKDIEAFQVLMNSLEGSELSDLLDEKSWQQLLIKQRRWRQKKYIDKKVFRDCSDYICKKDRSRLLVAKRHFYSDEVARALENPDQLIERGDLLKDGNTATVACVEIVGKRYVLKRYNIKKPVLLLLKGWRRSRAATSWRNGLLLEMLGIPTAKSYVFIEQRWGAVKGRSYLLCEHVDASTAYHLFVDSNMNEGIKKIWAKKIFDLFALLKRSQISHGDLKAQNILCPTNGPVLIDLDGLQADQTFGRFYRQFNKDILRFRRSWSCGLVDKLFIKHSEGL